MHKVDVINSNTKIIRGHILFMIVLMIKISLSFISSNIIFFTNAQANPFFAEGESSDEYVFASPLAANSRIREFVYRADAIYFYTGVYGDQSSIVFDPQERFVTISMGNQRAWLLEQAGTRIFLKPIANDANTTLLIITNKRVYRFVLVAVRAESLPKSDIVFETRFKYPVSGDQYLVSTLNSSDESLEVPDTTNPTGLGFDYTYAGMGNVPAQVFDDGKFTYIKLAPNQPVPAIFSVDSRGFEGIVNYRIRDGHIIIEQVGTVFVLRDGSDIICIYNETNKHPFILNPELKQLLEQQAKNSG